MTRAQGSLKETASESGGRTVHDTFGPFGHSGWRPLLARLRAPAGKHATRDPALVCVRMGRCFMQHTSMSFVNVERDTSCRLRRQRMRAKDQGKGHHGCSGGGRGQSYNTFTCSGGRPQEDELRRAPSGRHFSPPGTSSLQAFQGQVLVRAQGQEGSGEAQRGTGRQSS
jgi:hypothetical protein